MPPLDWHSIQEDHGLAFVHVPNAGGRVPAGGNEQVSPRLPGEGVNAVGMTDQARPTCRPFAASQSEMSRSSPAQARRVPSELKAIARW